MNQFIEKESNHLNEQKAMLVQAILTYKNLYPHAIEEPKHIFELLNRMFDNELDYLHQSPKDYHELYIEKGHE